MFEWYSKSKSRCWGYGKWLFVTKFGTKGIVNLGKLLPGVGAVVGGGLDFVETKMIANRSYKWFFKHDFSVDSKNEEDIAIYESDLNVSVEEKE